MLQRPDTPNVKRSRSHASRWVLLIGCASLLACGVPGPDSEIPPVDTLILVSIDSLRADHLGAYGYDRPTSPTIDRLAGEGLLFSRAYSTTSWTLPSHAALLTGLDDYSHGAIGPRNPLPENVDTLAEQLGRVGVRSVGFFTGPFLHPSYGFGQGFGEYVDCTSYGWEPEGDPATDTPHDASHRDVTNPILLEKISGWLDARSAEMAQKGKRPHFFVFIHMWDVHYDYIPPPEYVQRFDPDYRGDLTGEDFLDNERIHRDMPPRDLQHLVSLYDAEIRYTDDTLGELLRLFEQRNWLQRSAVIVTSDHGEEFFEHGGYGHGLSLDEEVLHVPLILWIAGQRPVRSVSNEVVSLIDVMPMVCDLFGADCRSHGAGVSLWPQYWDPQPQALRGDALAEITNRYLKRNMTAVVDEKGKLIRWNESGRLIYYPEPRQEGEARGSFRVKRRKLARYPAEVRETLELLQRRETRARREGTRARESAAPSDAKIDPDTLRQLEALGYLEEERKSAPGEGSTRTRKRRRE